MQAALFLPLAPIVIVFEGTNSTEMFLAAVIMESCCVFVLFVFGFRLKNEEKKN